MTTGYTMIDTATVKTPSTLYASSITPRALVAQGQYDAQRIMSFPGGMFSDIVYSYSPHRTVNFDTDYLLSQDSINIKTQGGMSTTVYQPVIQDVIVSETWSNIDLVFYRKFKNFIENQFAIAAGSYIQWQPRDRNANKYNIILLDVHTGSRGQVSVNAPGGTASFMVETLTVSFKIVSKV